MAKPKVIFQCTDCGNSSPKWIGKCPVCAAWNTYVEEIQQTDDRAERSKRHLSKDQTSAGPIPISEIQTSNLARIDLPDKELNRVLGGGLVPGSITLIGGQPGIGKSTLLLHVALKTTLTVLYVSGEESENQIKRRAMRIGPLNEDCLIYNETNIDKVLKTASKVKPELVIIDSIQTLYSSSIESTPGSISQVRDCTWLLQKYAKASNIPVLVIGHINKEGSIAGPKLLEHIVDTVVQFEGDRNYTYRILRTLKNRFGSTDELGIYEMNAQGLREVNNPSELLIANKDTNLSGSAISASIEGARPILAESQALVSAAVYGTPQRSANGYDVRKLHMLLAVLEKRCGLPIGANDVFLNIAGGVKIVDPGLDLSIIAALLSSIKDLPLGDNICFTGEVGLLGEVRPINRIEQRIIEADRLGYQQIFTPSVGKSSIKEKNISIQIVEISNILELMEHFE